MQSKAMASIRCSDIERRSAAGKGGRGEQLFGISCIGLTALGWGINWPATKILLEHCPPLSGRGIAGMVAGLILFAIATLLGETLAIPRLLWGRLTLAALLNVSAWMGLTTASMVWLPAGQAAMIAYTMPVWATLLAWPLLDERPTRRQTGAVALGICGTVTLIGVTTFVPGRTMIPGVLLGFIAAISFALGTILSKRTPIQLPRIMLAAWQITLGSLPLLGAGLIFENPRFTTIPLLGWLTLAYTATVSMGACYILWFAAVKRLRASIAAIGTFLTPCIGVVASSLAIGESLTLSQVLSLGLIGAGIILSMRSEVAAPNSDRPISGKSA
jgi:drug/metabolite transporter (DMT)-like permease